MALSCSNFWQPALHVMAVKCIEMLGIPSSHALIWDYDMQDHLPLQFQLRIDTADEPPNQIGYCSIRLFSCFRLYNAVSLSRLKQQNDWTWDSWPSRRSLASLRCVAAAWETQGHRLRSASTWVPGLCTLEKDALSFFGSASHTLPQAGEDQTT